MKLGDLFIKLGLKSQEFEQGINKAKDGMSGLMTVAKSVGGVLASAFSVQAMVNFFTTSVKLANEQIAVENELAAALNGPGADVGVAVRNIEALKKYIADAADALQNKDFDSFEHSAQNARHLASTFNEHLTDLS